MRLLAFAMALNALVAIRSTTAAPADIFSIGAPAVGSAPPKASDIAAGDSSVATQTGAFQYSYPIAVPPGRGGMQAHLALSYSSQAPIYGTIANGWSLDIPIITEDTSGGRLWWQDTAQTHESKRYKSSMAGGRYLVAVNESSNGALETYRAKNDATFARYQRMPTPSTGPWWRVLTPDGLTYTFGDVDHVNGSFTGTAGCTIVSDEYAPLTHVVDAFGNAVDYYYEAGVTGECRIAVITWGQNANVPIADFARVKFTYSVPSEANCPASVPLGAQTSYRTGTLIVTGASELDTITATAYAPGDSGNPVHTRTVTLSYWLGPNFEQTQSCGATHSSYRSLDSIQETAIGTDTDTKVALPAVTFTYGDAWFGDGNLAWGSVSHPLPWSSAPAPSVGANYNLGWGYRFNSVSGPDSSRWPTVEATMVDVDGDGKVDRLVSAPYTASDGKFHCRAQWFKNNGNFSFGSAQDIPMPTLKWASASAIHGAPVCGTDDPYAGSLQPNNYHPESGAVEGCSLNYQRTNYKNGNGNAFYWCPSGNSCSTGYCSTLGQSDYGEDCGQTMSASPTYLAFRWIDIDGDGLIDLVASPIGGSDYNLGWGEGVCGSTPAPEPQIFGEFPQCPQNPYSRPRTTGAYTMCGGMYPWMIYRNHGRGVFGQPSSDPTTPLPDSIVYQPIPLETDAADSSIYASPGGQFQSAIDLDGDGHTDGAYVPGTGSGSNWIAYSNTGNEVIQSGEPKMLYGRFNAATATGGAFSFGASGIDMADTTYSAPDGNGFVYPISTGGLVDINGDGLADHWKAINDNANAQIEYNDGTTFRQVSPPTVAIRPANDGFETCSAYGCSCVAGTGSGTGRACYTLEGERWDSSRTIDTDLDGRPDVVQFLSGTQTPGTHLNQGGDFSSAFTSVEPTAAMRHRMVASGSVDTGNHAWYTYPSYTWEIRSDMMDFDGDGIPEAVDCGDHTNGAGAFNVWQIPTPSAPPRLLIGIDNQRGATTTISYAAISDPTVVERTPGLVMPRTEWVVKTVTSTDSFASTTSTSSYRYINPHYSAEGDMFMETGVNSPPAPLAVDQPQQYGFRGFESVTTTSPSGAQTVQRYDYTVDWSGRLKTTLVIPAEAPTTVSSIDETTWGPRYLFCTLNAGCALKTYHALQVDHWTCKNGQNETACRANIDTFTRTVSTPSAFPTTNGALYKDTEDRLQASTTPGDGDRLTDTTYVLVYDASTYRLLPQTVTKSVITSGSPVEYAKTHHSFDTQNIVALTDEVSTDSTHTAITRRVYDMQTGFVLQRRKPVQDAVAQDAGPYAIYTPDSRKLFVAHETTEPAGYNNTSENLDYTYEYGTGTLLDTKGPNVATCVANSNCPTGDLTQEEHKLRVDGLGRPLEHWETFSTDGTSYGALRMVGHNTYVDNAPGMPTSVTEYTAYDATAQWSFTYNQHETDLDGHGRPIKETVFTFGTAAANQVTSYAYNNDGTLKSVTVPDPSQNLGTANVTYTYTFDSLGRPKSIRRPDSTIVANQSGADLSYDGLSQTATEVVGSAGGQIQTTTTKEDMFGRLVEVDEQMSASPLTWATTFYTYGPDDNVATITDPGSVVTTLFHDFAGRRTQISRGARSWVYTYDGNGNMLTQLEPCSPTPTCNASYTTSYSYDALDRLSSKLIAPGALSQADIAYFGVYNESLEWDDGGNVDGRLKSWKTYAPGERVPKLTAAFGYDAQGHVTEEDQTLGNSLAGYPAITRTTTGDFYVSGMPRNVNPGDFMTTGGSQTLATLHYDRRNLPTSMDLTPQPRDLQTIAVETRNVAGLVTKRRTDQNSVPHLKWIEADYQYDKLGRVTSEVLEQQLSPSQLARQDVTYFGNDDPATLDHWLGPDNHKHFTYTYDLRHQLTNVGETQLPNAFTATYEYDLAGRFGTANESAASLPGSDVKQRYVTYHYAGSDPEEVTSLTQTSGTYATYTYDLIGNMTNRTYPGTGESWDFVYDGQDQLRRVTKKINGVVQGSEEYWYDNARTRTLILKRDSSGNKTELIAFNGPSEAHYDGTGTLIHIYSYLSLGTEVARIDRTSNSTTKWEYLTSGLQNDTIAAVDRDTGTVDASFDYAPFGELIETTDAGSGSGVGVAAHRLRLNDKYQDEISDVGYYGFRFYDKTLIGWTQQDPLYRFAPDARWAAPRRGNLYAFSLNNPMRYLDPDGRDSFGAQEFLDHTVPNSVAGVGATIEGGGWGPFAGAGETSTTALREMVELGIAHEEVRCAGPPGQCNQAVENPPLDWFARKYGWHLANAFINAITDKLTFDPTTGKFSAERSGPIGTVVGLGLAAAGTVAFGWAIWTTWGAATTAGTTAVAAGSTAAAAENKFPFEGFTAWGRAIWGKGVEGAQRAMNAMTPAAAKLFDPAKVEMARDFYLKAAQNGRGADTAPARALLMETILRLQGED